MSAQAPKKLPDPTMQERADAAQAARTLRAAIAGDIEWGEQTVLHIDLSRPRRGVWIKSWANVPGFKIMNDAYEHDCLPGWSYERSEIKTEMIPDLEALAERGVRPTQATRAA